VNSTIVLGIASIALAFVFRSQTGLYPEVARRLPVLLIWIVVGLAAMMIAETLLRQRQARRLGPPPPGSDDEPPPRINWPVVIAFGVAIVAYVALIPWVGYLVTTTVFIAGALLVSRILTPAKAILTAFGTTAAVWVIFIWALNLPVPILPFLK